ncbi:hypothetical protein GCM10028805_31530 [Spirosoma harenae]
MNAFYPTSTDTNPIDQTGDRLLGAIFESAPVCIVSYRAIRNQANQIIDFKPLRLNERAVITCGRSRQEIMNATLLELFPQFLGSDLFATYMAVIQSGEAHRSDYYLPPFGGWFDISITRIAPDELAAIFININDRKQTELQMRQQAELLTKISQSMQMAVSSHQPVRNQQGQIVDFVYTYFNEKAREWLPVDWQKVVGKTVRQMQFAENVDQTVARLATVVETGNPDHFDAITTDGRIFYNIIARSNDGTVATFIDVTEQRRSEQRLLELKAISDQQTNLLQSILDASLTTIACYEVVRDETNTIVDFRITLANQAALEVLDMTADELYGKTLCELNPKLKDSDVLTQYVQVYETGKPIIIERESKDRHYYVSIVKFGDGVLASAIDITENRHSRAQLEAANVALKQSNENLQSFAYVASHDLQEPLRKIKAFGDLLINDYSHELPERGQDIVHRMHAAAERMSRLIQDLLALSRLTTQKRSFTIISLNEVVTNVLSDLERVIIESGAIIELGNLPTISGDPLQLSQLFQNLLSNALKFRKADQSPHIQINSRQIDMRDIPAPLLSSFSIDKSTDGRSELSYHQLTIRDNGIGFNANQYGEMIFGAFQRLHGRGSHFAGTGIGLTIAKKVIENHTGAIVAQSQEGEGATFVVYLPAR